MIILFLCSFVCIQAMKDDQIVPLSVLISSGLSEFHMAAQLNDVERMKMAFENKWLGTWDAETEFNKSTALYKAAKAGSIDAVNYLLNECKVDVNKITGSAKETAAHGAARRRRTDVIKILVAHGANHMLLNDCQEVEGNPTRNKYPVLRIAKEMCADDIVEFLTEDLKKKGISVPTFEENQPVMPKPQKEQQPVSGKPNKTNNYNSSLWQVR